MEKIYNKLFKNTLTIALTVIIASAFIVAGVYAATTISGNIETAGTFEATGNATTSANLVVGTGTKTWAAPTSTLTVDGSAHFTTKATSSSAFWIGTGGTINSVNLEGGDLYVQNDAEIDGVTYMNRATTTSATTTDYLYVGYDGTEPSGWDFSGGDFYVGGASYLVGKATTADAVVLGATAAGTDATTTITFGAYGAADKQGLCLKFFTGGGTIWCYVSASTEDWVCSASVSCEE